MIPPTFHQIWLGPDPLHEEFEAYQESWKRHHPGWELRLWREDNLPSDLRRPEVYDTRRKPVERADILRLDLIWRFGGVYTDTDFECLRPIDELLEGVEFFTGLMKRAGRSKPARVNNAIFGAAPGSPILNRALDELRVHEIGARYDKHMSGAMFFNELVMDHPDVTVFPPEYFYPTTELERRDAYGIHHAARLWHDVEGLRHIMVRAEERLEKTTQRLEKERQLRSDARRAHAKERREHARTKKQLERLEQEIELLRARKSPKLRVLFFLRSIHFDRVFENFLRALLQRGHELHVALMLEKRGLPDTKTRLFDEFSKQYRFSYEKLPPRRDPWLVPAVALRHALDYLRYFEPEFGQAHPLRERARARAPFVIRMLLALPPLRSRAGRRLLGTVLRRLEAAIPVPRSIRKTVEARGPEVVLVSPLVGMGSIESEYLRAAQQAGIPTVLPVASWDNLTNKGVLRDVPTLTIVWNKTQVEEAVRLHALPREQVVAVGAHCFDHWFSWKPSTTREQFAKRRQLDPERPLLLYLGSSHFIAGDETPFIREWLGRVREHPRLREAAVLLRPHPQNDVGWAELDVDEPGKTVVWPRVGTAPTDDEKKADYFDSLFHAGAVVGINTSALIEAAILHRPVLTLVSDHFPTQEGTLHFSYIAARDGRGVVTVARTWEEHLDQIADAIETPEVDVEQMDAFVRDFVRPNGLDVRAAPGAVEAVERAAATETAPLRRGRLLRGFFVLLTPLVLLLLPFFTARQMWRKLVKAARRLLKAAQRRRKAKRAPSGPPAQEGKRPTADVWLAREQVRDEKEQAKATRALERAEARATKERMREEKQKAREAKAHRRDPAAAKQARREQRGGEPQPARAQKKDKRARQLEKQRAKAMAKTAKRRRGLARAARRRWKLAKWGVRTAYNLRYRPTYRRTIAHVPSRDELPALLNARRLVGHGAEIGVRDGKFSDRLLRKWKGRLLISIDPWLAADPDDYVDRSNVAQDDFDSFYEQTKKRLARYASRSEIWRMTSLEAAERIPDGSLDFAYIDARHDYASVAEDLHAWFPKVKPGGVLAGHDYAELTSERNVFEVKSAVDDFFAARGITVHCTDGPSAVEMLPSWIAEVPAQSAPAVHRTVHDATPA